jgi:hypothetical protein
MTINGKSIALAHNVHASVVAVVVVAIVVVTNAPSGA